MAAPAPAPHPPLPPDPLAAARDRLAAALVAGMVWLQRPTRDPE